MSDLLNLNIDTDNWLVAQNIETRQLLNNPLLQKDIWRTIEDLGLKVNEHQKVLTISFKSLEQDWLKLLAKLYILVRSQRNLSPNYLYSDIHYLKRFSKFIHQKSITTLEEINNQLFEEFDYYLRSFNLSSRSVSMHYMTLINFFNLCRQEGWLEVNTYWFKGKYKNSTPRNDEIEYIPEEIWQQLDQHLHYLPEQIQRMVLVIKGTGLRIGELLNLSLDCLRQRGKQWRLRFFTEKYQTKDELPICVELVVVIQEQQEYIRQHFGDRYDKLFAGNHSGNYYKLVPKTMQANGFNRWLNKLAQKHNIRTHEGQVWHFNTNLM